MKKLACKIYKVLSKNRKILCLVRTCSRIINNDKEFIYDTVNWGINPHVLKIESGGSKNPNKIVYIIKEQGSGYGFFAEFRSMLTELLYADSMGLSPSILFGENFLYYQNGGVQGEYNPFQYYFLLKNNIENSLRSSKIVYSLSCHVEYVEECYGVSGYNIPEDFEIELARVFNKYVDIKKELKQSFDQQRMLLFGNTKVLGIHYRGTDYKKGYDVHPVAATIQQQIALARKAVQEHGFETVFLATDEEGVYQEFQKELGNIVKCYEDVYRGESEISIAFSKSEREQHSYKLGVEVLRDTYTLSHCAGLIAGLSQVAFSAKIMKKSRNETYEYIQIINNGINHNKNYFRASK